MAINIERMSSKTARERDYRAHKQHGSEYVQETYKQGFDDGYEFGRQEERAKIKTLLQAFQLDSDKEVQRVPETVCNETENA